MFGGAPVRAHIYSWWEPNLVKFSKQLVVSLGAKVARLGLSVGKQRLEP